MGSSKGKLYEQIEPKLRSASYLLFETGKGDKPKKFFIRAYGADSYDAFLEDFIPGPHQDRWDGYDWHKDEFTKKEVEERAISLMDALHRDLYHLYKEDEINSLAFSRQSEGKWLKLDKEILEFTQK